MPNPVVNGLPMSKPPVTVLQFTVSISPASLQARVTIAFALGHFQGRKDTLRDASSGCSRSVELRSLIPTLRRAGGDKRAGFPAKKSEYLILPDGAAQATAVVVGAGSIPVQATLLWRAGVIRTGAIPALIGVQPWPRRFEECAAVNSLVPLFDVTWICAPLKRPFSAS